MSLNSRTWFGAFLSASVLLVIGVNACSSDSSNGGGGAGDGTDSGAVEGARPSLGGCTPDTKECVNASLARVCPSDGAGWLSKPCNTGEACEQGECKASLNATTCETGSGSCVTAAVALR